jgi:hypothetical protein
MATVVVCRAILQTVQILVSELDQSFCKKNHRKKGMWVKHWIHRRGAQGASNNLIRELKLEYPTNYNNFLRMDENQFNDLLAKVASKFSKTGRRETTFRRKWSASLNHVHVGIYRSSTEAPDF